LNCLDKISYYLSYTDCIPIINLPSGIVHLICGIRDSIFKPTSSVKTNEGFEALTRRKLDNWTHLDKALAIISVVGTLILLKKKVDIAFELDYVKGAVCAGLYGCSYSMDTVPKRLFNDREWLEGAFSVNYGLYFTQVFEKASLEHRQDKKWVSQLISSGQFRPTDYNNLPDNLKKDRELALTILNTKIIGTDKSDVYCAEKVFQYLPESLRNIAEIARKAFTICRTRSEANYNVIMHITDKSVLESDDELCLGGVQIGCISFKDLNSERRSNYRYALAAVQHNHRQWADIPLDMQSNAQFRKELREYFMHGLIFQRYFSSSSGKWYRDIINDIEWFRQYWKAREMPQSTLLVRRNEANSFELFFN